MERDWHTWFILVLDILNWIFILVSWASLAAAISTTTNALMFCKDSQIQDILNATPNLAGNLVTYLRGLQQACNMTYAAIAFGVLAWYSIPVWGGANCRLSFCYSVYYTVHMLLNLAEDADLTPEERSESEHTFQGTEGETETKSEAASVAPPSEIHPVEIPVADPKPEAPVALA
jgi:hypothetical protein